MLKTQDETKVINDYQTHAWMDVQPVGAASIIPTKPEANVLVTSETELKLHSQIPETASSTSQPTSLLSYIVSQFFSDLTPNRDASWRDVVVKTIVLLPLWLVAVYLLSQTYINLPTNTFDLPTGAPYIIPDQTFVPNLLRAALYLGLLITFLNWLTVAIPAAINNRNKKRK